MVGADFRFGHARRGDVDLLRALGVRHGFRTEVMADFRIGGERVRSSRIRELLAAGDFDGAARLLGRRFSIGGHVVRGARLGHALSYPTANLRLGRRVAPVGGIFAVRVHGVGPRSMPGVASLGVRPTVDGTEPLLEAHLFDFDGDLYGRRIAVEFVAKLRDEEKFDDLDALVRQMDLDAHAARAILGQHESSRESRESSAGSRLAPG
jgi:riboflavin kinase/FMN adenylyltransferase